MISLLHGKSSLWIELYGGQQMVLYNSANLSCLVGRGDSVDVQMPKLDIKSLSKSSISNKFVLKGHCKFLLGAPYAAMLYQFKIEGDYVATNIVANTDRVSKRTGASSLEEVIFHDKYVHKELSGCGEVVCFGFGDPQVIQLKKDERMLINKDSVVAYTRGAFKGYKYPGGKMTRLTLANDYGAFVGPCSILLQSNVPVRLQNSDSALDTTWKWIKDKISPLPF